MDNSITPKATRLHALDGLRGVLAVWIAAFHLYPTFNGAFGISNDDGVWWMIYGSFRTDMFFVLSGFTVAYVYKNSWKDNWAHYYSFCVRRFLRLFFPHAVVLAAFLAVIILLPNFTSPYSSGKFTGDAWFASLILIQNWFYWDPVAWNAPTWNISALWAGYIFLVPGLMLFRNARLGRAMLCLLVFLPISLLIGFFLVRNVETFSVQALGGNLRMIAGMSSGFFLFKLWEVYPLSPRGRNLTGFLGIFIALFCMYNEGWILYSLIAGPCLIMACTGESIFASLMKNKVCVWLGTFSYSLYISHYPVIQIGNWYISNYEVQSYLHGAMIIGAILLGISISTFLVYEYVERRFPAALPKVRFLPGRPYIFPRKS